jgi:hypothetical protein
MPRQRSVIAVVTAFLTFPPEHLQKLDLPLQAARLLGQIALVMVVGVLVLASARAIFALAAGQPPLANVASRKIRHMKIIISHSR